MFFKYKRTPILALIFAAVISILVVLIFQQDERPFTVGQLVLLYFIALLPSVGLAFFTDPLPKERRAEYLKVNFYDPNRTTKFKGEK